MFPRADVQRGESAPRQHLVNPPVPETTTERRQEGLIERRHRVDDVVSQLDIVAVREVALGERAQRRAELGTMERLEQVFQVG